MTKKQFFKFCQTHSGATGVKLCVRQQRVHRGMDFELVLVGSWLNSAINERTLYTPTPGRQFQHDVYRDAHRKLDIVEKKFQRWLDEYLATQGAKSC